MSDGAQNVDLTPVVIDGVAHRFSVNGGTFVRLRVGGVPAVQRAVEPLGLDAHEDISNDVKAGDDVAAVLVATAEPLPGFGTEAFGPIVLRLVSAHSAQHGCGGKGQNRSEWMASTLCAARVGDIGKEMGQGLPGLGADHELGFSCEVGGFETGLIKQGVRISLQGFDEDHFGCLSRCV